MKKTYHISPSTTIIRRGNAPDEILEYQPAGWPIWPSDNPTADAKKRNEVLCAWLSVAAKELKSLWAHPMLYPLVPKYINNIKFTLEQMEENLAIIQEGDPK